MNVSAIVRRAVARAKLVRLRRMIGPRKLNAYTLDGLLARSSPLEEMSKEEREWLHAKPFGGELI
jgi:hypothetical protein